MAQPASPTRYDTTDRRLARLGADLERRSGHWRLQLPPRYDGAQRTLERRASAGGWLPPEMAAFVAPLAGCEPVLPVNGTHRSLELAEPVGVVGRALANSVARFLHHEGHVRLGDDNEAVHQARISIRRVRADLRTFAPVVDAAAAEALRHELATVSDTLGRVRDADVLTARLALRIDELAVAVPDDGSGPALLIERARDQRVQAQRELLELLSGPRYVALLEELGRAPSTLPRPHRRRELAGLAQKPWRRVRSSVGKLGRTPHADELHAVRLQVKRARYAAEAVASVGGKPMRRFARALAGVQDVLGNHHDAVEAAAWLQRAAAADPSTGFVAGLLVAEERTAQDAAERAWRRAWRSAERASPWR